MAVLTKNFYAYSFGQFPAGTYPGNTVSVTGNTPVVSRAATTQVAMVATPHGQYGSQDFFNSQPNQSSQTVIFQRYTGPALAAQTISAQTVTYIASGQEGNTTCNLQFQIYVVLWRPSTGALVGQIASIGPLPEVTTVDAAGVSGSATSTAVTAQDGDVIIVEVWRSSVAQSMSTAYLMRSYYGGEAETGTVGATVATVLKFTNDVTLLAGTKFYLDASTFSGSGTYPTSTICGSAPTYDYQGSSNRTLSRTIPGVSATTVSHTQPTSFTNFAVLHGRFVSEPLAAQTINQQIIYSYLGISSSSAAQLAKLTLVVAIWRPSTGALVGRIIDNAYSNDNNQGFFNISPTTPSYSVRPANLADVSSVTCQDQDVMVLEVWQRINQTQGANVTTSTYFGGTTDWSTTTTGIASFVYFPETINFYTAPPSYTYSGSWGMNM